jgi:23S rRNA (pseudouridine1915-N3)-methyltransferase
MLSVKIICIGKLKESFWKNACAEYAKRLKSFCTFSIIELPESRIADNPSQSQIDTALITEGQKILSHIKNSAVFALCIEGVPFSSEKLSETIDSLSINGTSSIVFVIGSSYGLSNEVKEKAKYKISMSAMTFPHQLARVMLCEQIYRSFQIINHGKYHK